MFKRVFKIALIYVMLVAVVSGTSLRGERPQGERPEKINNELKAITKEMQVEHEKTYLDGHDQQKQAEHIDALKERSTLVHARAKCDISGKPVAGKKFYVFADGRTFLCDELVKWILPHLETENRERVLQIQKEISSETNPKKLRDLEQKLDEIVGSSWTIDDVLIDSIDKPLDGLGGVIGENDDSSWHIG